MAACRSHLLSFSVRRMWHVFVEFARLAEAIPDAVLRLAFLTHRTGAKDTLLRWVFTPLCIYNHFLHAANVAVWLLMGMLNQTLLTLVMIATQTAATSMCGGPRHNDALRHCQGV